MSKRKNYSPDFTAKVAFEIQKGKCTVAELPNQFCVHPICSCAAVKKPEVDEKSDALTDLSRYGKFETSALL